MALFRKRSAAGMPALSDQESFAGILLCACACDGLASREELQALFTITGRMLLFQGMSRSRWNAMIARLSKLLTEKGELDLVIHCSNTLTDFLRTTVFANACDIVLADGPAARQEKSFLDLLQKSLGLDRATALTIVEVMIAKNRG